MSEWFPYGKDLLVTTNVAFQGEHGAFSEEAARQLLGSGITLLPCRTFEAAFAAVSRGRAHCAVVPIENSLAGSIYQNYDLLMKHRLAILGETNLRIVHCLIGTPNSTLKTIKKVHSHPVALAQCSAFLSSLKNVEAVPSYDTAGSVLHIRQNGSPDGAAIAGEAAAKLYGGIILKKGVEDDRQNFTRFLVLAKPTTRLKLSTNKANNWKTSIVFAASNQPGALFRALAAFVLRDIDLAKIESRPIPGKPWEYSFYLDFLASSHEPAAQKALAHLGEMTSSVRVLGSYLSSPRK